MCKANIDFLIEYLLNNTEDLKSLSEWKQEFNTMLPKHKRLSLRELAFAFRFIKYKNLLNVEKNYSYYSFAPSEVH